MVTETPALIDACKLYLSTRWESVSQRASEGELDDVLPDDCADLIASIHTSLVSAIKSYHYVLPTQVLCKVADPTLDAHSLQKAWGVDGAFDARTVAHAVIVPFDRENHSVLGGSPEPYVNNPLRCTAVISENRVNQKNQADWDRLVGVLDRVEGEDAEFVALVFDQILVEVYRLLANVIVTYPVPSRIGLESTQKLLQDFLATKSGGDRLEVVCTALFRIIGSEFSLFDRVDRDKVNAADSSSGRIADIECWSEQKIVLLVEVKDRTLILTHVDTKLERARAEGITQILFIAEQGKEQSEVGDIDARIETEFRSGQNVYVTNLSNFALGILILLGEAGRARFLREIGNELDRSSSAIDHRKSWADLLKSA